MRMSRRPASAPPALRSPGRRQRWPGHTLRSGTLDRNASGVPARVPRLSETLRRDSDVASADARCSTSLSGRPTTTCGTDPCDGGQHALLSPDLADVPSCSVLLKWHTLVRHALRYLSAGSPPQPPAAPPAGSEEQLRLVTQRVAALRTDIRDWQREGPDSVNFSWVQDEARSLGVRLQFRDGKIYADGGPPTRRRCTQDGLTYTLAATLEFVLAQAGSFNFAMRLWEQMVRLR